MTDRELKQTSSDKPTEKNRQEHQERNVTLTAWLDNTRELTGGGGGAKNGSDAKPAPDARAIKVADMVADQAKQGPLNDRLFFRVQTEFNGVLNASKHLLDADRMRSFNKFVTEVNSLLGQRNSNYRFMEHGLNDGDVGTRLNLCSINRDVMVDGIPLRQVVHSHDYVIKRVEK